MQNQAYVYPSLERPNFLPKIGHGSECARHGEILHGVFEGPDARLVRGSVGLTCDALRSKAVFSADATGLIRVEPSWKTKALRAVELAISFCDVPRCGGTLKISSNIPARPGFGSSTSDVVAAIRAVTGAFGIKASPEGIANLAARAADSIAAIFSHRAVLFADDEGRIIENFGGALPSMDVLGFNAGYSGFGASAGVSARPRYDWWEVEAFRPLVGLIRRAVDTQDAALVGRVATASARINQRHAPIECFDLLERLAGKCGALGLQIAHRGSVAGLLFDQDDPDLNERIESAKAVLAEDGFRSTWRFATGRKVVIS